MTRGVLYLIWGEAMDALCERSIASLRRVHPDLPVHVERLPNGSTLLDKARMAALSPFESTLYLDCDTVVLDDLTFGFEKAERFGLACAICECPWGSRYPCINGDMVEYNTGVVFFSNTLPETFKLWQTFNGSIDSSISWEENGVAKRMGCNDQAGFAMAMDSAGYSPFVLPLNWNFRQHWHWNWFGRIKVWHDTKAPPKGLWKHNEQSLPMYCTRIKETLP